MCRSSCQGFTGRIRREYGAVTIFKVLTWFRSPLNVVGMPFYDTPLLSNFSLAEYATASSPIFHPPPKIPTSILSSMRVFSGVGYAVLPKEMQGKRNVVCRNSKGNLLVDRRGKFVRGDVDGYAGKFAGGTGGRRESGPRFRSEKSRAGKDAEADDVSCRRPKLIVSRLTRLAARGDTNK